MLRPNQKVPSMFRVDLEVEKKGEIRLNAKGVIIGNLDGKAIHFENLFLLL